MPKFPSFWTTGQTVVLPTQPINYQPLNLAGMIQAVRERPTGTSPKKGTPDAKDFEIEGRIGAVNQYMRPIRQTIGKLQNLVDLYGAAAYEMPEYSKYMTELDNYSNSQRQNIVKQETEMYRNYKENTKGKGAMYDLFNWKKTKELKTVASWNERNQYAETTDLGDPQTKDRFIQGFDENPTLYGIEDAREGVDALFNQIGHFERGNGWSVLDEKFIKKMRGALTIHNTQMSKVNFGKGDDLDAARDQSIARVFTGELDFTDPIVSGYFQSFLQRTDGFKRKLNGKGSYIKDDGTLDESMAKDFEMFVKNDIEEHYKKRKIDVFKQDQKKSFNEGSDYHYERADENQLVEEMLQAMKQQTVSSEGRENFGLPMDNVFNTGYLNLNDERDYILAGEKSPFVVQQDGNGNNYISVNENYDEEALRAKAKEYYEKKYPKGIPAGISAPGYENADAYAEMIVEKTNAERNRVSYQMSQGMGMSGTTRQVYDENYIPAGGVPKTFLDGVNSEFLVGKTAEEIGTGNVVQVGETFMNLTDFGDAVYEGAGGALKLGPNTISSNTGIKTKDGRIVLFTSPEWQNASPERKEQLANGGVVSNWNEDGTPADAAAFQGKPVPMDEATQDILAKMAQEGTINSAYFSPGTLRMAATFSFKNEKEAAKALEGKTFKKEVPLRYTGTNSAYDRTYDDVMSHTSTRPLTTQLIRYSRLLEGDEKDINIRGAAKQLLEEVGVDPNSSDGKVFLEVIEKNKDNLKEMGRSHIVDLVVNAKLGQLNEAWNFKTAVTFKDQPIVKGNRLDKDFKDMTSWRQGTSKDGSTRNMLTLDMNVTDVAMNGITDPKQRRVMRGFTQRATNGYWSKQRYSLNKNKGKTGNVQTQTYGALGFGGASSQQGGGNTNQQGTTNQGTGRGRQQTTKRGFAQGDYKWGQNYGN